jgi:uncharacterized delta-60 repeat protein
VIVTSLLMTTGAAAYPAGDLDPTFNSDGVAVVAVDDGTALGSGVAVGPDGSVTIAGFSGTSDRLLLARLTSAGRFDPTFSGDGWLSLPLPIFEVTGLALQDDGRAVVTANGPDGAFIVRFTAGGRLDPTFSRDGVVRITFAWQQFFEDLEDVVVGPRGSVFAAGRVFNAVARTANVMIVRLGPFGDPAPGFGDHGILTDDLGTPLDWARGLTLGGGGSITAVGIMGTIDRSQPFVVRYEGSGRRDLSFGGSGLVREERFTGPAGYSSVTDLPGGSVVAVGSALRTGEDVWALGRYSAVGSPTVGFHGDGLATVGFGSFGQQALGASAEDVVLDGAGRFVVVGTAGSFAALARITASGTLDPSFGVGGQVVSRLGATEALGAAVALSPGREIVMGGSVERFPGPIRLAAARFIG